MESKLFWTFFTLNIFYWWSRNKTELIVKLNNTIKMSMWCFWWIAIRWNFPKLKYFIRYFLRDNIFISSLNKKMYPSIGRHKCCYNVGWSGCLTCKINKRKLGQYRLSDIFHLWWDIIYAKIHNENRWIASWLIPDYAL